MNIKLENIGIVKNSSIQLDGLTVITGQNNSGKTTVGKVIYSLVDSVSNLQSKAKIDRQMYIANVLDDVQDNFEIFRLTPNLYSDESILKKGSAIYALIHDFRNLKNGFVFPNEWNNIETFSHELRKELMSFNVDSIDEHSVLIKYYNRYASNSKNNNSVKNKIKSQINRSVYMLNKLFETLDKDPELIDYARESINQTLRVEFANQIQPVRISDPKSKIVVSEDNMLLFAFDISDNKVTNNGKPVFLGVPYKKAYFIDDPFVLDSPADPYSSVYHRGYAAHALENTTILDSSNILPHASKLNRTLKNKKGMTVFEETVISDGLTEIKKKINEALSGEFEFSTDGEYYVKDGKKLQLTNLATGSKMFSILKILIEKGEVDGSTLLILDEPEAHLHPSWQNKFAEIIVLLVKYLNTCVLLTSHSPNFVLAIDAYMRKYDIIGKTNFYQTNQLEDDMVEYVNVNQDMGQIYSDFMQYLSEVKALRDYYYNGMGDNHDN